MKIVIVHYRYYHGSGPETYLFNVKRLFENNGHTVIPFSASYPNNEPSPYSEYFYKPIVDKFHLNENKNSISVTDQIKIVKNSFYNKDVFKKLTGLLNDERPDVVYVLQYGTKLSTSIFDAAYSLNIPVVLRLSDFNLVCAKNTFFNKGQICTKCIDNRFNSVMDKCVHDSLTQSFVYFLIQKFNHIRHFQNKIDAFIVPSVNTMNLIKKTDQFKHGNFYHVPTFISKEEDQRFLNKKKSSLNAGIRLCYLGRVSEDKGLDILINAMINCIKKGIKVELDIIGDFNSDFGFNLKKEVDRFGSKQIKFLGVIDSNEVNITLRNYHFSVVPSKWYDNMPNSLIESSLEGVPVIVSKIGSLEELIQNGYNGFTFEHLSSKSLEATIISLVDLGEKEYYKVSENCIKWIREYCDKEKHLKRLLKIFKRVINEKTSK
ncbi:glycosyltransferase family 4 protein [Maribacter sp. PR1]|uniref:Glycosyltransferase family 4 protein n=1 Tax=Maribacter cobaltidurans TaxID=1178778 RepID=A0ABU7IW32_9FLAO|nr:MULTISPECIES: glycosyltransferase family 4 protein [Maribacter]MDC6389772.1 glycosyltransferase family 4 protein [Maribacter sp. PR1]MEE1977162.1 glycosyltransferase family 4 protein [Maribacter cobaltidurans]